MANAKGMTFHRKDDGGDFQRIAGIRAYGDLDFSADTTENTLVDEDKNIKTFGKGMITLGEFEVTLDWKNFTAAETNSAYKALQADFFDHKDHEYQLQLPERFGKAAITLIGPLTNLGEMLPSEEHSSRKIKITLNDFEVGTWV